MKIKIKCKHNLRKKNELNSIDTKWVAMWSNEKGCFEISICQNLYISIKSVMSSYAINENDFDAWSTISRLARTRTRTFDRNFIIINERTNERNANKRFVLFIVFGRVKWTQNIIHGECYLNFFYEYLMCVYDQTQQQQSNESAVIWSWSEYTRTLSRISVF